VRRAYDITYATNQQTSLITLKNNVFVDLSSFGLLIIHNTCPVSYDKFDVNNNLYYKFGWDKTEHNGGIAIIEDTTPGSKYPHNFDDLHELAPAWETTEYSFDPEYKEFPSWYNLRNKTYEERFEISYFEDGVFNVTSALVDKGTSSLPKVVDDMLNHFNIYDRRNGNNYDLGPYETGAESWIPSSKKDKDRNRFSPEKPVVIEVSVVSDTVSSAHSLYLSLSLLLACFYLFLVIF